MGDKKVKGMFFKPSQGASVAHPEELHKLRLDMKEFAYGTLTAMRGGPVDEYECQNSTVEVANLVADGDMESCVQGRTQCRSCGCVCTYINYNWKNAKFTNGETHNSSQKCVEQPLYGYYPYNDRERERLLKGSGREYRWPFDFRRGAECSYLINTLGLNSWEFQSLLHWLTELEMEKVDVSGLLGLKWDVEDETLFPRLLKMIAYREGCGDWLAEGMARAGIRLGGIYQKFSNHQLNGYGTHAIGTDVWSYLIYPYWVPVVLGQAIDVRDCVSDSCHAYTASAQFNEYLPGIREVFNHFSYDCQHAIGYDPSMRKINGGDMDDDEFDDIAYTDGEYVIKKCQIRGVLTANGTYCEQHLQDQTTFLPEIFDPDLGWEAKVYNIIVGTNYSIMDLERFAEKTLHIQRCYNVLEFGRNKAFDMSICDNIHPTGDTDTGKAIDPIRFEKMLDRFYEVMGWDNDGIPSEETLLSFGLVDCNEKMKAFRS